MADTPDAGGSLNDRMAALRQQQAHAPQQPASNQFAFEEQDLTPMQAIRAWIAKGHVQGFAVINILIILSILGAMSLISFVDDLLFGEEDGKSQSAMQEEADDVITVTAEDEQVRVEVPLEKSGAPPPQDTPDDAFDEATELAQNAPVKQPLQNNAAENASAKRPLAASAQELKRKDREFARYSAEGIKDKHLVQPPTKMPRAKPAITENDNARPMQKSAKKPAQGSDEGTLSKDFRKGKFASHVYQVQLGAFSHPFQLENEWLRLKTHHPSLVQNISPAMNVVNYGSSGMLYRLRLGPLANEEKARALCVRLQAAGFGCVPIKPTSTKQAQGSNS